MSLTLAVEAFIIRRGASFGLRLRALGLRGNLFLAVAFAFGRHPTLSLFVLLLYNHHMTGILFNAFLWCFQHAMQLTQCFLHAVHMEVHNELLVVWRERLENNIYSQISIEGRTQSLQARYVTNHFDHMRTNWTTFSQLARNQGTRDYLQSALAWFPNISRSP